MNILQGPYLCKISKTLRRLSGVEKGVKVSDKFAYSVTFVKTSNELDVQSMQQWLNCECVLGAGALFVYYYYE